MKIELKFKYIIYLLFLMIQLITFNKQFVQTNDEFRRDYNKPFFRRLRSSSVYYPIDNSGQLDDDYYTMSEQTSKKSSVITNYKSKPKKPKKANKAKKPKNRILKDKPKKSLRSGAVQSDALKEEELMSTQIVGLGARLPALLFGNTTTSSHKFTLSAPNCGLHTSKFIVNGYRAEKGSQPWIAAVVVGEYHYCSAVIINDYWLISAAHAFERPDPSYYTIRVGNIDRKLGTDYSVERVIVHPLYNQFNFKSSDIAIVKVNGPIKMGPTVKPACLPGQSYEEVGSKSLYVSGWGYTNYSIKTAPQFLQTVRLNVIPLEKCADIYGKINYTIYRSQICTLNKNQDACQGDSGGPAIKLAGGLGVLTGIVSYGVRCAEKYPGVFTKVSFFLNWIQEQMKE